MVAIFSLVPLSFLLLGVGSVAATLHDRAVSQPVPGWVSTTGSVVAIGKGPLITTKYGARVPVNFYPVISYADAVGVRHQIDGRETGRETEVIGTPVPVNYDPAHPEHARDVSKIPGWWGDLMFSIGMLLAPLLFVSLIAYKVIVGLRRARRDAMLGRPGA